ncbi:MAG TPA: helix-turn-helix domain-containing protein [Patescibacteria group bacterium]|jgi:excisionase family DNA binding protein|nr:helix-turn-helix domain-containing protein [Patescibacteria group bacterium]
MTTDFNTIQKLYNIDELSDLLSVSKITIYRLVESRSISFYKIKGCIRFSENDVLEYLDKNRIEPVR